MELLSVSKVLLSNRVTDGRCAHKCAPDKVGHPFWSRVEVGARDACWPFKGSKDRDGYGRFQHQGKKWRAHRFALFLTHGSAVADLCVLHTCDNPACCNPDHLTPGTHQQNMADRDRKGRQASAERNGRAKLTPDIVRAIRAAYVPYKSSVPKLAARFGVNFYIVRDIINRVTWRGIEPEPEGAPAKGTETFELNAL